MPLFRKKPVVVHAEQFRKRSEGIPGVFFDENDNHWVVTMHGDKIPVVPGDWIIREPDGEHYYPCKPDVFAATYEIVEQQ